MLGAGGQSETVGHPSQHPVSVVRLLNLARNRPGLLGVADLGQGLGHLSQGTGFLPRLLGLDLAGCCQSLVDNSLSQFNLAGLGQRLSYLGQDPSPFIQVLDLASHRQTLLCIADLGQGLGHPGQSLGFVVIVLIQADHQGFAGGGEGRFGVTSLDQNPSHSSQSPGLRPTELDLASSH